MNGTRVVICEVLGPEIVTMLNAMIRGNDGSLSTIHSRSVRDLFGRILTYVQLRHHILPLDKYPYISVDLTTKAVPVRRA